MYLTDALTAELCKLMENTFRDVNIALANELAKICEQLGANAWDVIEYANKHPRVNLHCPGPGVGGHCLAVDPWFVVASAPEVSPLIELARSINDSMPVYVAEKVRKLIPEGSKVTILGCTYKPDVDDLRESPILNLIALLKDRYEISVVDPFVERYNIDLYRAAEGSDLIILGVHHKQFEDIDFKRLAKLVRDLKIFDTRNFLNRDDVLDAGFEYHLLGSIYTSDFSQKATREVAVSNE